MAELQDDFRNKQRDNPGGPADGNGAVTIRLKARSGAEVVEHAEGYESKGDDVGPHHPFLVNLDATGQNGVKGHGSCGDPGDSQSNETDAKPPAEGGGSGHAERSNGTNRHARKKEAAGPAMQADIAVAEASPELQGAGEQSDHAAGHVHEQPAAHGPVVG